MKNNFCRTQIKCKELLGVINWSKDQHSNLKNHFVWVNIKSPSTDTVQRVFLELCSLLPATDQRQGEHK